MNPDIRFGSYRFPATFSVASVSSDSRVELVEIPRRDGAIAAPARLKAKTISVRGVVAASSPDAFRKALDQLRGAVSGGRQKLYLQSDRYIWAQKAGYADDYDETSLCRYARVAIEFVADSPWWEDDAEAGFWLNGLTGSDVSYEVLRSVDGTITTYPVFEVVTNAAGTLNIRFRNYPGNGASYDQLYLNGTCEANKIYLVDCESRTCTLSTGENRLALVGPGSVFWGLEPMPVTKIYVERLQTSLVSAFAVRWRSRWV